MQKSLHFTILVFLCTVAGISQNGPAELWRYSTGGSRSEQGVSVLECTDGGSLLIGSTDSKDGKVTGQHGLTDAWIVKRKPNGTEDWQQCIGTGETEYAHQAVEVADGYVVVGQKNYHAWIFKINKYGVFIWENTFPTSARSALLAIRIKPDGTFMVGGYKNGYYGDAMLWNLSSEGSLINGVSFNNGSAIHQIRFTTDGNMLIMGDYRNNEEGCFTNSEVPAFGDLWLAKVSNSFQVIWSKYYGGTTYDDFVDGEITSGNEVYLLGRTYCKGQITGPNNIGRNWRGFGTEIFTWLAKVNASGNLGPAIIVSVAYPDYTADYHCVTVDCRDQPVIGGGQGSLSGSSPAMVKYSSDLTGGIWSAELTGDPSFTYDLFDIHFPSDAAYLACGSQDDQDGNYDPDYLVLKTTKDPVCAGSANKCQNITPISCGQTYNGNTAGRANAFNISDLSSCHNSSNNFSAPDQLFEVYKPNSSGDLVITLFSNDIDHDIFLLSSCNPVQCLYKSSNPVGSNGNNIEIIRVNNAPAGYYYILVDGSQGWHAGPFSLTVNCGLLDCGNAKPIECKQILVNETNQNGFNNVSLYCNPSSISDPGTGCTAKEKVYSFQINSTQNVTISLSNIRDPNDDFEMFLFKDCNEDVCLDYSVNPKGQNETITRQLSAGRYYIVVDGWKNSEGNYDLTVDWNCCSNPVEIYNCGYITYKYAGSGNDLKFTFTSSKAIATGKKWKVGNTEISTATGPSFTYTFPNVGEYIICFPYLNANNCLEYCCYRVWISNPFDCFLFDYKFNPSNNNYTFSLDLAGASNIVWKDDTGGGTIGGGPISNPIPAPPGSGCVEKTITVTYYLNGRWYICCRKIWICNPFDCLEFDYRFDLNANGMVFQLNNAGASYITWKDDTGGGDIGGGPISNPLPVPPNPGDCIERIISVKYFANGRWYLCCRRVWICNPFECLEFDYRFDLNANGMVFQLNSAGASYITWKDDTGGGDIGGGPISNPLPVPPNPGDCIERIISVRYFANGRWYLCCRRVWICNPFDCGNIIFRYDLNARAYQFELTQSGASLVTWKDDTGGGSIGGGPISNPVPPPTSGPCEERIITARYFYNGRWYICCKRFWLCDPKICSGIIQSNVLPSGQVNLNVSSSYTDVFWYNQLTGTLLGTGTSLQVNFPYGSSQEICVQYIDNGRTYMCCKNITAVDVQDPAIKKASIHIHPNPNSGHFMVSLQHLDPNTMVLNVFNLQGVIQTDVRYFNVYSQKLTIDASLLSPGWYCLQILSEGMVLYKQFEIL
ncbi:MAG: PPC domain-containing protein [Saprospiraceae bacterium]|nr:PPC domain-containing protein [Saprospiraceae bacterium]